MYSHYRQMKNSPQEDCARVHLCKRQTRQLAGLYLTTGLNVLVSLSYVKNVAMSEFCHHITNYGKMPYSLIAAYKVYTLQEWYFLCIRVRVHLRGCGPCTGLLAMIIYLSVFIKELEISFFACRLILYIFDLVKFIFRSSDVADIILKIVGVVYINFSKILIKSMYFCCL